MCPLGCIVLLYPQPYINGRFSGAFIKEEAVGGIGRGHRTPMCPSLGWSGAWMMGSHQGECVSGGEMAWGDRGASGPHYIKREML